MSRDTVAAYMRENYAAPRMILAAAGNIDHNRLVDLAATAFAGLPHHAAPRTEPARYVGGDYREQRDLEQVHIVLGFPGVSYTDPDHYAASVLSTALGGGMSSRLFQEIREKRGLVYSIYSFAHAYQDGGLFGVYAGTGEDEVAELVPTLCEEVAKLRDGLDPAELKRARAQLKAGILMSLESTSARCEQLAQHLLVYGRPFDAAEIVRRIEAVTADDVARVARRITAGRPTFTALGPVGRIEEFDRIAARFAP
jgi:predicted Zn-dependent peptidase